MNAHVRQRLEVHRCWIAEHEPALTLTIDAQAERASIAGSIDVPIGAGRTRKFQIEIRYRRRDGRLNPFVSPDTYDPAGQFEPHEDRHIRQEDGHLCLWLPETDPNDFGRRDGMQRHLGRVREFIVLQLMFDDRRRRNLHPYWPGEQWNHGLGGHRQWVREQVRDLTPDQLQRLTQMIIGKPLVGPASLCPCRSGRLYRRCHRAWVLAMRDAVHRHQAACEEFVAALRELHAVAS